VVGHQKMLLGIGVFFKSLFLQEISSQLAYLTGVEKTENTEKMKSHPIQYFIARTLKCREEPGDVASGKLFEILLLDFRRFSPRDACGRLF
jgi:hypothetical protein